MILKKMKFIAFLLIFFCNALSAGIEYFAYWQQFTWEQLKCGKYELEGFAQFRFFRPAVDCRHYEFGERLKYEWFSNLQIGTGVVYILGQRLDDEVFRSEWRMEFEINPFWKQLVTRNRLEIRRRSGEKGLRYRSRHRVLLYFPIENCTYLKQISIHDEVFYNYNESRWSENRFTPINLQFVFSKSTLDAYIMLRSTDATRGWNQNWVFGTEWTF